MQLTFDNDAELVAGLLEGIPQAFECYFHRCYPRLYRFALRRLGREALAEEAAQEAIVAGLRDLENFRGEAALLTWLSGICRNEIVKLRRRHPQSEELHPQIEDDPEVRAALELLAQPSDQPETLVRRQETIALVQSVLDFLPAGYGDVLQWKYVEGLSVAEMAGRLGKSEKAIESLLTRAREAFRGAAGEMFDAGADLVRP